MKKYLYISVILLLAIACTKHEKRETKYEDGQLQEQFFVKETKDGSFIKDGEYKSWYEDGQNQEAGKYSNGVKVGNWKSWHENGQLKFDLNYTNDTLNGKYIEWHYNGQKAIEKSLKMGKNIDEYSSWYENGQPLEKSLYNNEGELDGLQIQWYENGTKLQEVPYLSGKKEGVTVMWSDKGKHTVTREFKDGKDINLPATYKAKNGSAELMLNDNETFHIKYLSREWYGTFWQEDKGDFYLENNKLVLEKFNIYTIQKFNADTIIIGESQLLIRAR